MEKLNIIKTHNYYYKLMYSISHSHSHSHSHSLNISHIVTFLYDSMPLKYRIYEISELIIDYSILDDKYAAYIHGIFIKEKVPEYLKKIFYFQVLTNGGNVRTIPDEYLTEKNVLKAIKAKNNFSLYNVPKKYLTKKICYAACSIVFDEIEYVPRKYKKSILVKLIIKDNEILEITDVKYLTENFLIKLIDKYWTKYDISDEQNNIKILLSYVPLYLITPKIKQHIKNGPQIYMLK